MLICKIKSTSKMYLKQETRLALLLLTVIEIQCATTKLEQPPVQIVDRDNSRNEIGGALQNRTFEIDYEMDTFVMDGVPFRFVSGAFHYFRCPHQYWRDRMKTMRAAGLNAVETYVEWSFHEPEYRQYKWTEDKDLVKFIEIAQEEDLYVILRPGPYICAERDNGGHPYWLLSRYPNIKMRTSDENYKSEVQGWYSQLMSKLQRLFYGNGGPIIMVQVENEYGSYKACDKPYMSWLAELTENWVRGSAVLFTTDGASESLLKCGSTPGVYATVDFGSGQNITAAWNAMRKYSPKGPLVNSEYYPGWLTHWGEKAATVPATKVVEGLNRMLANNANVNFYMFYGGTNFGFTAGANLSPAYVADITSYDYDAPMTEAGDITPKYTEIKKTIAKYLPMPNVPVPPDRPKGNYGTFPIRPILPLLSNDGRRLLGSKVVNRITPITFEEMEQFSGLVLYETTLPSKRTDPSLLTAHHVRDRALIYLDEGFLGALSRTSNIKNLSVMAGQGRNLKILVENQGRVNYVLAEDFKGIGNVTLNSAIIYQWKMTGFPLETIEDNIKSIQVPEDHVANEIEGYATKGFLNRGPMLYQTRFSVGNGEFLDTFLDMTGWGKGVVWLNDINLGRYWPGEGPQVTLYVPGVYFKEENSLVILELQSAPLNLTFTFVDSPNLGYRKNK